jgi:hypothetical protein
MVSSRVPRLTINGRTLSPVPDIMQVLLGYPQGGVSFQGGTHGILSSCTLQANAGAMVRLAPPCMSPSRAYIASPQGGVW